MNVYAFEWETKPWEIGARAHTERDAEMKKQIKQ